MIAAIVNPSAGSGSARRRWPHLLRQLNTRLGPINVHFTEAPGHATSLARDITKQGCSLLIVAGGDGTLNEVVNGIPLGPQSPRLGILPLASGGDFARMLGVSRRQAAVAAICREESTLIDLFRARFVCQAGERKERLFVNAASFGLGAMVAERARRLPRLVPGKARYLAATIPVLASSPHFLISMTVDGHQLSPLDITIASIANGQFLGGGIRMAPRAALDDGLADITVINRVGLAELVRHLPILYSGAVYSHPKVKHWRVAKVVVTSEDEVPVELDGEPVGKLPLEVDVIPAAIRIAR